MKFILSFSLENLQNKDSNNFHKSYRQVCMIYENYFSCLPQLKFLKPSNINCAIIVRFLVQDFYADSKIVLKNFIVPICYIFFKIPIMLILLV